MHACARARTVISTVIGNEVSPKEDEWLQGELAELSNWHGRLFPGEEKKSSPKGGTRDSESTCDQSESETEIDEESKEEEVSGIHSFKKTGKQAMIWGPAQLKRLQPGDAVPPPPHNLLL